MMFVMPCEEAGDHTLALYLLCLSPFQSGRSVNRVMVEKVATAAELLSQTVACI